MKLSLYLIAALAILTSVKTAAQCEAVALPYTEDFEGVTVPALPDCTTSVESNDLLNPWETGTISQSGQQSKILKSNMLSDAPSLSPSMFNSRAFELDADKNYRFTFDYGISGNNSTFYIEIYLTNVATGEPTSIHYFPAIEQSSPGSYTSSFINVTQSGTYTLGIEIRANKANGYFYVDNLIFDEWICPVPETLSVTQVTATTASFSWSGESPTHYQYSVVQAGEQPVFAIASALNTATRANLQPATEYTVYVKRRCENQGGQYYWSDWSEGVNFTTLGTLGVDTFAENNFQYYPNPVTTTLNINYNNAIDTVMIYSSTGQHLLAEKPGTTNTTINTSALAAGVYYVAVSSEGYTKQVKLIKE